MENEIIKQDVQDVDQSRAIAQVQGQIVMAKKFPRDEVEVYNKVNVACSRKRLAENAIYSYPKGGTQVEGPSIRMAEMLAHNYGNMEYGARRS